MQKQQTLKNPLFRLVLSIFSSSLVCALTAITIALAIYMAFSSDNEQIDATEKFLSSIVGLILFMFTVYANAWRFGSRDLNLVKYNHLTYDSKRGLKAGLYAVIPFFVFITATLILSTTSTTISMNALLEASMMQYYFWFAIVKNQVIFYYAPLVIPPLVAWYGYLNGYKQIYLRDKIMLSNTKVPDTKRLKDKRFR